jgi:hypothetical protein
MGGSCSLTRDVLRNLERDPCAESRFRSHRKEWTLDLGQNSLIFSCGHESHQSYTGSEEEPGRSFGGRRRGRAGRLQGECDQSIAEILTRLGECCSGENKGRKEGTAASASPFAGASAAVASAFDAAVAVRTVAEEAGSRLRAPSPWALSVHWTAVEEEIRRVTSSSESGKSASGRERVTRTSGSSSTGERLIPMIRNPKL